MNKFTTFVLMIFLALIAIALLPSCRTAEQAAQRHIRLALKKDPTIISRKYTDTVLVGVAKGADTVYLPGKAVVTPPVNIDSIEQVLSERQKKGEVAPAAYVYKDSTLSVSVVKDEHGKLRAKVEIEPKVIIREVKIPYEVKVRVPGTAIKTPVDRPFYVYKWFWMLLIYSILATIYILYSFTSIRNFVARIIKH